MMQVKPYISSKYICNCGGEYQFESLIWQGLHVCEKLICGNCNTIRINSLPVNQSFLDPLTYYPVSELICDPAGKIVKDNWFTSKLKSISNPVIREVDMHVEKFRHYDDVLILNTLDYVYGHSLLYLLNLQRIAAAEKIIGIIVIVQPMLRWLVPEKDIAEIWTVKLGFHELNYYYPTLSGKINSETNRFQTVWLSQGHLIPTNENINIERFTGIRHYDFLNEPAKPEITFIWREDPDRLWVRNIFVLKGFKKLGFRRILIPLQFVRVLMLFRYLKKHLGDKYSYTIAGPGNFGKFPSFINDKRIMQFNEETEKKLCRVYAESILVVGVHGSGMLLPSAHAGMTVSLMPSRRWGNFAEDILYSENDVRLAAFQKRVVPMNLCISELRDIILDMVRGRDHFIKKFFHSGEL